MTDSEPLSSKDIQFHSLTSLEINQNTTPQALTEIKHQLAENDLLWLKNQKENFVQQIRDTEPNSKPPTGTVFSERSLYGMAYDGFAVTATTSEWELGGGYSLQQSGVLTPIRSDGHIIEYKANKNTPQDWNLAKETVLNDTFFKRHQEFGDAIKAINPTKADKYPLGFYLDPNQPEDKAIINQYQRCKLKFQETEYGWQPILDLSNPPGNEFLYTPTATEFFSTLEKSHLKLNQFLINELLNRSEQRYGNSYVTLGREIAKLVSDPNRLFSSFFSTDIDNEDQLAAKINSLETPKDPAAALLVNILKQISQPQSISDLAVSPSRVSFKAGACKDLESYFSASVNENSHYVIKINGKKYLKEGSHHVDVNHMMINLEPVIFNGVLLPAGNLLRDSDSKDGYHYMRPTAFCFDQDYTQQVFGEEYRESINSWGPPDKTFQLISQYQQPIEVT